MVSADATTTWQNLRKRIEQKTSTQQFSTWFRNASVREVTPERLIMVVPSDFHADWIASYYRQTLETSVAEVMGGPREVCLEVEKKSAPTISKAARPARAAATPSTPPSARGGAGGVAAPSTPLTEGMDFDRFVAGPATELAKAAAFSMATAPCSDFSTMLILGAVGLGKTHLLQAISREALEAQPEARVAYLRGEGFLNDFVEAVANGETVAFRERYRNLDLICFDDLHVLAGKSQSQAELLHTLTAWVDRGAKVVFAATCPQGGSLELDHHLLSQLSSGFRVTLQLPDPKTRREIVQVKARQRNETLGEDVLSLLSELPVSSVRDLEGTVTSLIAACRLKRQPINRATALNHLRQDALLQRPNTSSERIIKVVCQNFEVKQADLTSRRRPQALSHARQVVMYLLRERTELSLSEIGELLGGRDHTTVLHGIRKIGRESLTDPRLRDRLAKVESQLDH